jgi:hypothetical protein
MKNQAKLYKEYQDWVKKQNANGLKEWQKNKEAEKKVKELELKKYEQQLKKHERNIKRIVSNYEKLLWWQKLLTKDPRKDIGFQIVDRPISPVGLFNWDFYIPPASENLNGFYVWLVEVKYKIK